MFAYGIDFGTTNSAVTVRSGDGDVHILKIDRDVSGVESSTMRSVLYFEGSGVVHFGSDAMERYSEELMPGRFLRSIKTLLPSQTFVSTQIFGKRYTIIDLIALILRHIKIKADELIGCEVDCAVLGRPVAFSADPNIDRMAEDRLLSAALKAGFKNVVFQPEPVAAGLACAHSVASSSSQQQTVLVGDFGGGTSDFSVVRYLPHGSDYRVLSTSGVYVGGDDFDSTIMWNKVAKYFGKDVKYRAADGDWMPFPSHISAKLKHWHLLPLLREKSTRYDISNIAKVADSPKLVANLEKLIDNNLAFQLFQDVERAKCRLSDVEKATISFSELDLNIEEVITRKEFEDFAKDHVAKLEDSLESAIKAAGVSDSQIDQIFLTGGTSQIPMVRKIFESRFGSSRIIEKDAFTSVVYGLGLSTDIFFR